jgi:RNA polymerase sigma-70 factor (ECF subfamily)
MEESQQFEVFVRAYQNMVFTTASRLVGGGPEAEDISQEVFLKAYERFHELKDSPTAGGWLKTVARNLALNHLTRYRARWRFFSEMTPDHTDEEVEWPVPEANSVPSGASDERLLLEGMLAKLPVAQRVPLVLYHFEEMSYEEIASRLRISISKVKTDIHRGREALRRRLSVGSVGEELGAAYGAPDACPS